MPVMPEQLDDDVAFGTRLRAERERLGLAVHELAHLCGRTDHTQRRYEDGREPIPIDYLQALRVRSEVDVEFVLMGTESRHE